MNIDVWLLVTTLFAALAALGATAATFGADSREGFAESPLAPGLE
jgi:hypothetical protein